MQSVPDWIARHAGLIALPVAGAVAQHLWTRYRNRLSRVRWSVQYQPLAFATEDFGWGKVEILYDGNPASNLHIATVQVQNASSKDLSNLRIHVLADNATVLRSAAQVR